MATYHPYADWRRRPHLSNPGIAIGLLTPNAFLAALFLAWGPGLQSLSERAYELFDRAELAATATEREALQQEARVILAEAATASVSEYDRSLARFAAFMALGWLEADSTRAIAWFRQAEEVAETEHQEDWRVRSSFAWANRLLGDGQYNDALSVLEEFDVARSSDLFLMRVEIECHLGRREAIGRIDAALSHLDIAPSVRCRLRGLRGQAYLDLGLPDVAAEDLFEQFELAKKAREGGDANGEELYQEAVLHMLNYNLAVGRMKEAVKLVDDTLRSGAAGAIAPEVESKLLDRKGLALAQLGWSDEKFARQALEVLNERTDRTHDESISNRVEFARISIRLHQFSAAMAALDEAAVLMSDVDPARLSGGPLRGYARYCAVRLSALMELKSTQGGPSEELGIARAELIAAFDLLAKEWRGHEGRAGGAPFFHYSEQCDVLSELVRSEVGEAPRTEDLERAFQPVLVAQSLATITRELGGEVLELNEIRSRLVPPGVVILSYLVAPDCLQVFALDDGMEYVDVPGLSDGLYSAVREFGKLVRWSPRKESSDAARDRRTREIDRLGREISERVFPPKIVARVEKARHVIIVGSEMVGPLPFEALPWGDLRFGQARAVSYLPSIPLGCALAVAKSRRVRNDYDCDLAMVAAPRVAPPLRQLEFGASEQKGLADPYRGRVARWIGSAATLSGLRDAASASARVLMIWTHGEYEVSRELPAGLLVTPTEEDPSGVAWYEDLRSLASPPVVVLAACGAANGPIRRGEDRVTRLDAAFLRGGARVVLLPSADAEEVATTRLLERFLRDLRHGLGSAEAMRNARAELAGDPHYDDPFYDSLVHVVGMGEERFFEQRRVDSAKNKLHLVSLRSRIAIAIGLTALLVTLGVWLRRRGTSPRPG